eukprot:CAMPEP_0116881012 /NCGR_PEP_ID=MMETSP0463-20121206/13066_1 /TAXON_ID=181622 /ORGANISM="Strombidinopsis sp, Strain SopsisLIS2011" /LENGTH=64 /DNA_ID=CAMNT_0004532415 /DNA_START=337 /DNA_END=531 /DNA_ORIENTATION=-
MDSNCYCDEKCDDDLEEYELDSTFISNLDYNCSQVCPMDIEDYSEMDEAVSFRDLMPQGEMSAF